MTSAGPCEMLLARMLNGRCPAARVCGLLTVRLEGAAV